MLYNTTLVSYGAVFSYFNNRLSYGMMCITVSDVKYLTFIIYLTMLLKLHMFILKILLTYQNTYVCITVLAYDI